jgi:hypothetical protein
MMIKILSFDEDYYSGKKYHGPPPAAWHAQGHNF